MKSIVATVAAIIPWLQDGAQDFVAVA